MTSLTLDMLRDCMDRLYPIVYYATDDQIARGYVIHIPETWYGPESVLIHPDDLEILRQQLGSCCRLIHLREYRPDMQTVLAKYQAAHPTISFLKETDQP